MFSLPPPPDTRALSWRPWTSDDIDALTRHMVRVHEEERLQHVPGADTYRWLAGQSGFDPARDSLVGFDADGEAHAEAGVWAHLSDTGSRAFAWAEAVSPFTDLRPFLIAWTEARARQLLADADPTRDRIIRFSIEEHRSEWRRAIETAGFANARSFAVMRRPLAGLPAAPPLPEGVRIEPWSIEVDAGVRSANNEAFADHWGSFPLSEEMWLAGHRDSEVFRPDLSFVALAAGEVVSFCLAEVSEEENAQRGYAEVYIHRVGTRRSRRRGGLASHLVVRTLEAGAAAGMDTAALDVDESSHTSATAVYHRLGFEVVERSIHYVKNL